MNDEFLYRLRTQPRASFAARLKARLDIQSTLAAARRRATKWYVFFGILVGAAAVASVVPAVRTTMVSWLEVESQGDATQHSASTRNEASPRTADGVRSGTVEAIRRADSSSPEAANAPAPRESSMDAVSSTSSAQAAPRRQVVTVVVAEAARGMFEGVSASFEDAYGYTVERKAISADDVACSRFRFDFIVTLGRLRDADSTRCNQRGTRLMEVPLAYDAYIAVVHRENTWAHSLTIEDLRAVGDRRPYDSLTTWNQLRPSWPSLPITVFGVESTNRTLGQRFDPASGRGIPIRIDKSDAGVANAIGATYGGLGFMSYATYRSQSDAARKAFGIMPVKVLGIVNQQGDVVRPSRETIQSGTYDRLSRPLLLHVNVDALYREEVLLFGTHAVEGASQRLGEHGLVPIGKVAMDAAARKLRAASRR